jgi:hypothetical protein
VPAVIDCLLYKQIQPDSNRPAHTFPPVIHHQRQKEEAMDDGRPLRLEDGRKYISTFLPSSIMLLSASDFLNIEHIPFPSAS